MSARPDHHRRPSPGAWVTTSWSAIVAVGEDDPEARRKSLEDLCERYWPPVFAFLRWDRGLDEAEAEDLAQSFFVHLMEGEAIQRADREVGRFRRYLKSILINFVNDQYRRQKRQKRGGDRRVLSLDVAREDGTPLDVAGDDLGPEERIDRRWARRVMDLALQRTEEEAKIEGREVDYRVFRAYAEPTDGGKRPTYGDLAAEYGLTDWGVYKRLADMRERLRQAFAEEVARTVLDPLQVEEEIRTLMDLL